MFVADLLIGDGDFGHRDDDFFRHFRSGEARRAQDGPTIARDKRNRCLLPALGTNDGVHHPRWFKTEAGLACGAAFRATRRFVDKPLFRVKRLLPSGPCEGFSTIAAHERPI